MDIDTCTNQKYLMAHGIDKNFTVFNKIENEISHHSNDDQSMYTCVYTCAQVSVVCVHELFNLMW